MTIEVDIVRVLHVRERVTVMVEYEHGDTVDTIKAKALEMASEEDGRALEAFDSSVYSEEVETRDSSIEEQMREEHEDN